VEPIHFAGIDVYRNDGELLCGFEIEGLPCHAPAAWHFMFADGHGLFCETHVSDAVTHPSLHYAHRTHQAPPTYCGYRAAIFDPRLNRCNLPMRSEAVKKHAVASA
jgi:hypothetical protein